MTVTAYSINAVTEFLKAMASAAGRMSALGSHVSGFNVGDVVGAAASSAAASTGRTALPVGKTTAATWPAPITARRRMRPATRWADFRNGSPCMNAMSCAIGRQGHAVKRAR